MASAWASVVCIIAPLLACSLLTYGFMALTGIGMKAATLPVAAFGVGIGVDDGIYLWSALSLYLDFINLFIMLLRLFGDRRD